MSSHIMVSQDVCEALERQIEQLQARVDELEQTIRDYINNSTDRAVIDFDYEGGKYANNGDTFNLLVTENEKLQGRVLDLEKQNTRYREALERIRDGKDNLGWSPCSNIAEWALKDG